MTEAYLDAQRRRRGSNLEPVQHGELSEKDKSKTYHDEAHGILGCQHYRRGAKLQCSTCNQWATCRYCHDEREDHKLIRYCSSLLYLSSQNGYEEYALHALLNCPESRPKLSKLPCSISQILL